MCLQIGDLNLCILRLSLEGTVPVTCTVQNIVLGHLCRGQENKAGEGP